MDLIVKRQKLSSKSTIGELFIGGYHDCFTLEPPAFSMVKPYAIPAGRYLVTLRHSMRFGDNMPHIENVPGFDAILIHKGNTPSDTHGCVVVGEKISEIPDTLLESSTAFNRLRTTIELAASVHEKTWIEIQDVPLPKPV